MAEFTSHQPGTFCWPELATTDQKSAVAFYRALFGWDVKTSDVWMLMVVLKLSRERHRPQRDNRVDIAGYAEVGDWIHRDGRADGQFPPLAKTETITGKDP